MILKDSCSVSVNRVSKSFVDGHSQPLSVISNVSFSINKGQIVALLGASGCGKTTLLRMISGSEQSYAGSINAKVERPGPALGYMQQGERLLPWLTVAENVCLGPRLIGQNIADKSVILERLDDVGMSEFCNAYPSQLSGGMSQRVLLVRTLATSPSLLLLDEPFGQLDVLSRRELSGVVRDYVGELDAACLLVTHSVEEAVAMADHILILSKRPAQIVKKFSIDRDVDGADFEQVERDRSLDQVQMALLMALGESEGQNESI